jgi:hypothetical protein
VTLSVSTLLEHLMPILLSAAVNLWVTAILGVFAVSGALARLEGQQYGADFGRANVADGSFAPARR